MSLESVMTRDPVAIEFNRTVRDAMELLDSQKIRHLPVLLDGGLVGMLSDRSLQPVRKALLDAERWHESELKEIMLEQKLDDFVSREPIFLDVSADLASAIDTMIEFQVGAVAVTEEGTLVGIVSYVDLLKLFRAVL